MRNRTLLVAAVSSALLLSGCDEGSNSGKAVDKPVELVTAQSAVVVEEADIVATVNGEVITVTELEQLSGDVAQRTRADVPRERLIEELVSRELLFQDADDQLFSPTVLEDVAFGPLNLGKSRDEAVAIARRTLSFLELEGFEDRVTYKLSGGEKRLVSLATVLAMEPEVLLLDEPFTGLDAHTKIALIDILNSLELSFILISHEFEFLPKMVNHIYTMEGGRILLDEELDIHNHSHAHLMGKRPHRHQ